MSLINHDNRKNQHDFSKCVGNFAIQQTIFSFDKEPDVKQNYGPDDHLHDKKLITSPESAKAKSESLFCFCPVRAFKNNTLTTEFYMDDRNRPG